MSPTRKTQPDILLLLIAATALLGVVFLTAAHQTYTNGHGLDVHLEQNLYGITIAVVVTAICVLEMAGWDWDRGYLDRLIECWNRSGAVGKVVDSGEEGGEQRILS